MPKSHIQEQFPLSLRKVFKKTLASSLCLVLFLLFIALPFLFVSLNDESLGGVAVIFTGLSFLIIFFIVLTFLYQLWYYNVYFYDLTDNFVIIKKGPIAPTEVTIPYGRIQDVYVDQDILDRIFGLYDVHLSSATVSSGMEAHIDGVEKQSADGLRSILLQQVQQRMHSAGNAGVNNANQVI